MPILWASLRARPRSKRHMMSVQRVFTRIAALGSDQVRSIREPRAYLRQAARNIVRDDARAASRWLGSIPIADVHDLPAPDPVAALEARDRLARIERAVQRLKPLARQIFLARRLDGYSYAEIAEQTGLSERGVRKANEPRHSPIGPTPASRWLNHRQSP